MSSFGTQLLGRKCFGTQTFSARHCLSELLMEPDHQAKNLPRRTMLWIFLIACVGSIFYNLYSSPSSSEKIVRVEAEPYQWPAGCENKRYRYSDEISSKCMDDRYFLDREFTEAHGIQSRTRRQRWNSYRVGNDARGIDERQGRYDVARVKRDVFYQDK